MDDQKTACLLLHGLGGGRFQFRDTEAQLAGMGLHVRSITLVGHDGDSRTMRKARAGEWLRQAQREYQALADRYQRVVVVGFSMGALLGLCLAAKFHPAVLVLVNTPVYFWNVPRIARNMYRDVRQRAFGHLVQYVRGDQIPIRTYWEFYRLLRYTRRHAAEAQCPTYILQSRDDDAVQLRSVKFLLRALGRHVRRVKLYPAGGHNILVDDPAGRIHTDIATFIGRALEKQEARAV